jgi:imidazolonepropionase-like amidohydrolase
MKKLLAIPLILLTLPSTLLGQSKPVEKDKPLFITHVNVIDATGAPVKPDMTVVITGDRITLIKKSSKARVPDGAHVIDAKGKFLIPGLWDMHVHWYDERSLPLFIANGVTGVRQMFGQPLHLEWRKRFEKGELLGPRQFIASPIVDGLNATWPGSIKVDSEEEARRAVRQIKEQGYDFVKIYDGLRREVFFAIADESKKQGISFGGHMLRRVTAIEAIEAGQRTFEHLNSFNNLTLECSSAEAELREERTRIFAALKTETDPLKRAAEWKRFEQKLIDSHDPKKAAALFARFAKNQTWQSPTLTVLRAVAFGDDPAFRNDARLKYMPRSIQAQWLPENDFRFRFNTADDWETAKLSYRHGLEIVREMRGAGVKFLAGTDALNPFCFPGFSLHDELALLVEGGLTPMEALQAATLNPAIYMGKSETLGTVETGKFADLVLLDANPLNDIGNTKRIAAVIVAGKLFDRAQLDGMLANAEKIASLKSIAEALFQTIEKHDVANAVQQYRELRSKQPDAYEFGEDELNGLGYRLMLAKKVKDAIEIFKLNVEAYPQSGNAYDGLAESYMLNGDNELAIESYKKSLELDPQNLNAGEMLKKLGAK